MRPFQRLAINKNQLAIKSASVTARSILNESHRKLEIQSWLQTMERYYSDRILTIDLETVRIWDGLTATAQKSGKIIAASDGLIAATALRHSLHIVTRNISDFEPREGY